MNNMDLVLEGGGVKGIGLVGAIAALREAGYATDERSRVAGTSAGAIAGSLVAARLNADDLTEIMNEVNYREFRDSSWPGLLRVPGEILSLGTRLGLYKGDKLHDWIRAQLAAQGVRTFGDLRIDNDPGSALPPEQSYRLVVVVSDISRGRMLRLPWDYQAVYGLDADDMPVADAVRASASIPYFFQPVTMAHRDGGVPSRLVDGGMLSNFPMDLFDREDGRRPRWPTLGVKLSAAPPDVEGPNGGPGITGLIGLTKALVSTMVEAHDRTYVAQPCVRDRTIFVPTDGVSATDFDLTDETRDYLYKSGVRAGRDFLRRWDFDAYLRQYRPQLRAA
jgi:NTE family protein